MGLNLDSQAYYVIAQLFTEPIPAPEFFQTLWVVTYVLFVHFVLSFLTGVFYRM